MPGIYVLSSSSDDMDSIMMIKADITMNVLTMMEKNVLYTRADLIDRCSQDIGPMCQDAMAECIHMLLVRGYIRKEGSDHYVISELKSPLREM